MKTQRFCRKRNCREIPLLNGFCKAHHEEDLARRELEDDAVQLLHRSTINEQGISEPTLKAELTRIQKWWERACSAINSERSDPILRDETTVASEWCIALAKTIITSERAHRKGTPDFHDFEMTREWVWDRFNNLEKGLMSNGIPRPQRYTP